MARGAAGGAGASRSRGWRRGAATGRRCGPCAGDGLRAGRGTSSRAGAQPDADDVGPAYSPTLHVRLAAGRTADVHLEVDTGMHRYGVDIADAPGVVEALSDLPGVRLAGMYTHYASADATDTRVFDRQLEAFTNLVSDLQQRGLRPEIVHASNSPALHSLDSCFDAVRPGIALYGVRPSPHWSPSLRPVMAVKAHVGRVFDVRAGEAVSYGGRYVATHAHRAAVIACGYADGYMRSLSGRGEVLLHGRRCRVLGTVCMDSFVVGLPDGLEAAPGDEAVVLGAQGEERVSAEELAERAGTIAYELLCGMCRRGSRIYLRPAG
ncbi:MAG: alanine racemase [Chloroflexia bacterium]